MCVCVCVCVMPLLYCCSSTLISITSHTLYMPYCVFVCPQILRVRQMLTEVLLEVTDSEIELVCAEFLGNQSNHYTLHVNIVTCVYMYLVM